MVSSSTAFPGAHGVCLLSRGSLGKDGEWACERGSPSLEPGQWVHVSLVRTYTKEGMRLQNFRVAGDSCTQSNGDAQAKIMLHLPLFFSKCLQLL